MSEIAVEIALYYNSNGTYLGKGMIQEKGNINQSVRAVPMKRGGKIFFQQFEELGKTYNYIGLGPSNERFYKEVSSGQ